MRNVAEVQLAHDLVSVAIEHTSESEPSLQIYLHIQSVLCWMLHHPKGQSFENLLQALTVELKKMGLIRDAANLCPGNGRAH